MKYEKYPTTASTQSSEYTFTSIGANGDTPKIIQYTYIPDAGACNLGFGVLRADGTVDDKHVTNNGDMEKILATVGSTVYNFTADNPHIAVVARGSTPARTRVYQRMISFNYEEIEKDFFIYGLKDSRWAPFQKDINYDAFLVSRKESFTFEQNYREYDEEE